MILINLLPHREARRQRRKVAFYTGLGVAAFAGIAIVAAWYLLVEQLTSAQQERNDYLSGEIKKLETQIKDVASLKSEIENLKARQKAVENLQIDRNVPVYVLNELVRQTPEGVYFRGVKQTGQTLEVIGVAQTQERISELLRNMGNNAEWLTRPELVESRATMATGINKEQRKLFDFSMRISVKRPPEAAPADAAASGAKSAAGKKA